jgi:hypothetical protein
LCAPPGTTPALNEAVAIEQGMDGAVGRNSVRAELPPPRHSLYGVPLRVGDGVGVHVQRCLEIRMPQ